MIYWLASYPKSGNTWLRLFLAAYRQGGRVDINAPQGFEYDDVAPANYQPHLRKPVNELTKTEFLLVRPAALLELCHLAQNRRVFVKTHNAFAVIDDIPVCPPVLTEGAVYVVRDPRDVAVSYAAHCNQHVDETINVMGDPQAFAGTGCGTFHALFTWSQHVESWRHAACSRLVVRYESLLQKPHEAFSKVVTHLGWDLDEDCLDRAIRATQIDVLRDQERESGFRECSKVAEVPFFRQGKAGGWRDVLTPEQVRQIERDHGETMQRLGYELEG